MIRVFVTGGTIDNRLVAEESGDLKTYIPAMLEQARTNVPVAVEVLMQKDSRILNGKDREVILKKIKSCDEDKIIVTHGTASMSETARYLGEKIKNKTIVLVGAAVPFAQEKSDAMFNFGAGIVAVQTLPKGVYVVMNGQVFQWNNVRKNTKTGRFEDVLK